MGLATQAKALARVRGPGVPARGRGTKRLQADMRVIAASNKNLSDEIKKGAFREDLYYRRNDLPVFSVERLDDIPQLIRHFLQEFSREYGQKPCTIDDDALALFIQYQWPNKRPVSSEASPTADHHGPYLTAGRAGCSVTHQTMLKRGQNRFPCI